MSFFIVFFRNRRQPRIKKGPSFEWITCWNEVLEHMEASGRNTLVLVPCFQHYWRMEHIGIPSKPGGWRQCRVGLGEDIPEVNWTVNLRVVLGGCNLCAFRMYWGCHKRKSTTSELGRNSCLCNFRIVGYKFELCFGVFERKVLKELVLKDKNEMEVGKYIFTLVVFQTLYFKFPLNWKFKTSFKIPQLLTKVRFFSILEFNKKYYWNVIFFK